MTANDPLSDYVRQYADRALEGLAQLEESASVEVIHETRTSLRRLRATLRTFAGSFPGTEGLDDDLRFVAVALGHVRDADVLLDRLLTEIDSLPETLVLGPVRREVQEELGVRRRQALDAVAEARQDERWGRAVAQLTRWRTEPPTLDGSDPATVLKKARRRVRRRIEAAEAHPDSLHSARKAAKRWRYAAELLADLGSADKHRKSAKKAQEVLGAVQDDVVVTEFLREHAALGARSGHNAFTTGLLYARAQQRIDEAAARAVTLA
ncbi:CHAD domain-containing protein [Desertihabitans aurantiacus]|uniref:CHAD domain-containing protein n=1 Tax=Desertihabitans aurantiacus TaxID=2282477 RepID=UPI000DF8323E|nr:CHAD domain-containing protein [Desertihabitans aurantiacus]